MIEVRVGLLLVLENAQPAIDALASHCVEFLRQILKGIAAGDGAHVLTLSAESAQLEEDVAVETADFDRSLRPQPGRNRRTFAARERGFVNEDMCGRQRLQPVPRAV